MIRLIGAALQILRNKVLNIALDTRHLIDELLDTASIETVLLPDRKMLGRLAMDPLEQ